MHPPPVRKRGSISAQKSYSPSFTSYFNTHLKQIAVRVTGEFNHIDEDAFLSECLETETAASTSNTHTQIRNRNCTDGQSDGKLKHKTVIVINDNIQEEEEELESEFEFDLANLFPPNGDLGPVYPVFNLDLLLGSFNPPPESADETSKVQIQLKTLFLGEHQNDLSPTAAGSSSSSSSDDSEGEELDSIPPRTYIAWTPNKLTSSQQSPRPPNRCIKSNSTGSMSAASSSSAAGKAKEFRLRDLLRRSKSDGKDGVMLITPISKQKKAIRSGSNCATAAATGKAVVVAGVRGSPARESYECHYYKRGREGESGNAKWKSYLPYKQDLVGFFVTPQGLRKIQLPPFY